MALNALQQGRYAVRLRENLVRAGEGSAESQYESFRSEIAATFGASGRDEGLQAEQMAARAWCTAREARRLGTKPECALESVIKEVWYTSLLRIRIDDRRRRIGLVFWVQRRRYWTLDRAELLRYVRNRLLPGWVGPPFSPQAAILGSWLEGTLAPMGSGARGNPE